MAAVPIYEYECEACHGRFEYMQSVKEAAKTACETCGGQLNKMMSASGFILKGGGWYKDQYASAKPAPSDKPSDKNKAAAASSGDAKTTSTNDRAEGAKARGPASPGRDASMTKESKPAPSSDKPASAATTKKKGD